MNASAFVLAAGFGTRLRPLTLSRPKPLVPVCGVPMLSYALALCARHGLTEVIVNAHYLAETLEPWAGRREGVNVVVSHETPEILGTGGGLRKVMDQLAEHFVVVNGDVLCDVDLTALRNAVPSGGAAMALRPSEEAQRYGIVAADSEGVVVQLASVASAEAVGQVARDTHFTGVHAMDRRTLQRVPEGFGCIVRTAYRDLVPAREVRGLRTAGTWLDVGDPPSYLDANLTVLRGEARTPLDPFLRAAYARRADGEVIGDPSLVAGAEVRGPVWIGAGARIGQGAVLDHCVIGADAILAPGATLTRTVVWDGCEVSAKVWSDEIIHVSR